MASFADAFSGESLNKILSDPAVRIGMQLLAQSGPQQGNPGFGQRLGQAGMGFAEDQHRQQLQQMRALQMQQAQQLQQQMSSPEVLQQLSPTARQLAQGGAPADQVWKIHELESQIAQRQEQLQGIQQHRGATLAEQQRLNDARIQKLQQQPQGSGAPRAPKQPTPRQTLDEPLPNGMIQRHIYDAETGSYKPYGAPFARAGKPSADPLDGGDPVDQLAGQILGLPGGAPLAEHMPQPLPQGADLLMNRGQPKQQAQPMAGSGSVPGQQQQPASGGPATPKTRAEYDALPVGSQYLDPATGRITTKRARN